MSEHSINDVDVTGLVDIKSNSILGPAHEHFVVSILMRLGFQVALTEVSGSSYDCIIEGYSQPPKKEDLFSFENKDLLRGQIKTARNSISFTGGGRGGVDREYNTEETENKVYKYSSANVDILIGVDPTELDLYLVPVKYIDEWGKSKAISKMQSLKNNWDILINWNDNYIGDLKTELPDFQ